MGPADRHVTMGWAQALHAADNLNAVDVDLICRALTEAIDTRREVLDARARSTDVLSHDPDTRAQARADSAVIRRELDQLRRLRARLDPAAPA